MILGIQIIGILFAVFMLYLTFLHRKRKEFNSKEYAFWAVLWVLFVIIALFPNILDPFTKSLSLNRTMDLLILLGFVFLIGLTFHNYYLLRKSQRKIENIVRRMAYKEVKK